MMNYDELCICIFCISIRFNKRPRPSLIGPSLPIPRQRRPTANSAVKHCELQSFAAAVWIITSIPLRFESFCTWMISDYYYRFKVAIQISMVRMTAIHCIVRSIWIFLSNHSDCITAGFPFNADRDQRLQPPFGSIASIARGRDASPSGTGGHRGVSLFGFSLKPNMVRPIGRVSRPDWSSGSRHRNWSDDTILLPNRRCIYLV